MKSNDRLINTRLIQLQKLYSLIYCQQNSYQRTLLISQFDDYVQNLTDKLEYIYYKEYLQKSSHLNDNKNQTSHRNHTEERQNELEQYNYNICHNMSNWETFMPYLVIIALQKYFKDKYSSNEIRNQEEMTNGVMSLSQLFTGTGTGPGLGTDIGIGY
jgi:hypothetical protein